MAVLLLRGLLLAECSFLLVITCEFVRACVREGASERGEGEGKLFAMRRMSHRFGTVWGGRRGRGRGGGRGRPRLPSVYSAGVDCSLSLASRFARG